MKCDWIDHRGSKPQYGFQVFHSGKWRHAAENGMACLYDTEAERDAKQAEFRKLKTPNTE